MDMPKVLAWNLAETGAGVYPFQKPEDATLPALAYNRISDRVQDKNHSAGGALHLARVQITHVASTPDGAFSLVDSVQTLLEGNKTDFSASLSADVHIENQEAEDIFTVMKEYLIQYKIN
jgi:hypothetical protein